MIVEADRSDGGVYQCNATNKWGHDYSLIQLIVKGKWWCNDDSFCLSRDITCWSWSRTIISKELLSYLWSFFSFSRCLIIVGCLVCCFPLTLVFAFLCFLCLSFWCCMTLRPFVHHTQGSLSCDSLEFSLNDLSPPSLSCISFLREKRKKKKKRETTLCVHLVLCHPCLASGLVCLRFLISVFSSFFFLVLPSLSSI